MTPAFAAALLRRGKRLRSSTFALRATADKSSSSEARSARSQALRGIRTLVTMAVAILTVGGSSVFACPQCFGAAETPMIDGAKLGVLVMLAITFAVQGAFVGFFFYLRKRAKRIADLELDTEWSELQGASRTS
jgi:heme/copper-type cytochrome/quinol oxidase subunit 2